MKGIGMTIKQQLFEAIGACYLKMHTGLLNNNLHFDHLMTNLITKISHQFQASISSAFCYEPASIQTICKHWMSTYGLTLAYGYEFDLIGYLVNDWTPTKAPDLVYKPIPQVAPETSMDFMGMLTSLKPEVLNQDQAALGSYVSQEILTNCVLTQDTKAQLNGEWFVSGAKELLDQIQTLKQSYQTNPDEQAIIIDHLLANMLSPTNLFYQALMNFKQAHNEYVQLARTDLSLIADSDDPVQACLNIVSVLNEVLDHSDQVFQGLKFDTHPTTTSILDVHTVLVNNSLAHGLLAQYQKEFELFDDVFYPVGGMTVSFLETSLAQYVIHTPGIQLLYQYTHISYLKQCELAIYLEQTINLIPTLYWQTVNKYQLDFDTKVLTSLGFQLKHLLKETYPEIIKYMNSINLGSLEMGQVVYSSKLNLTGILKKRD